MLSGLNACQVTSLAAELSQAHKGVTTRMGAIVVGTPGLIVNLLRAGIVVSEEMLADSLSMLVVDEADLIMSYGHDQDLQELSPKIPRSCQCILMSATGGDQLSQLQQLLLHNPVHMDLLKPSKETQNGVEAMQPDFSESIDHYYVDCRAEDKLLHLYVCLKFQLVRRRVLVFVNTIEAAHGAQLFLSKFGIKSVVLHAELPLASRHSILQQFNVGLHQVLLVADNTHARNEQRPQKPKKSKMKAAGKKRKREPEVDEEFGVTRGLDFKSVATVVNLDLPDTSEGYVHRAGRTGRAGNHGTVLTLFSPEDGDFKARIEATLKQRSGDTSSDGEILKKMVALKSSYVESLRYRAEGVERSCTKNAIKEARLESLRKELLNSKALKEHFEDNPNDKDLLEHDKTLVKRQSEPQLLMPLPSYISAPGPVLGKSKRSSRRRQMPSGLKFDPLKVDVYKWKPMSRRDGDASVRRAKSMAMHRASGVQKRALRHGRRKRRK
eukprot:evm.model.scf_3383.2 EVM.evm.TU.scf_3383.2   scf_3383:9797-13943(-)